MSLILAIEPDRRQVAQLISIVRQVPGAELILADTTERALESIGNGVPDLILVPALLSPQDDAALAAALRVIATAAHVQMLTIPTFATANARPKSRGVLSAFRRKAVEDAPLEGCDPKVFAEQISSYLERASEERAAAQLLEDEAQELAADVYAAPAQGFDDLATGFEEAETSSGETVYPDENVYADPVQDISFAAAPEPVMLAAEEPLETADRIASAEQLEAVAPIETVGAIAAADQIEAALEHLYEEPLPALSIKAAAPEPMALEEFVATLARTELPSIVASPAEPLMATAPAESDTIELDIDLTTELEEVVPEFTFAAAPEQAPTLDAFLADFERADLPVIEEVRAEQWMEAASLPEDEEDADEDDVQSQADIDLSIELEAVLHVSQPAEAVQAAASLKPFEALVPDERFEPFPLAAWQSWPRLEGTVSAASQDNGSDDSAGADAQIAEFEAALVEAVQEEILERFEPVLPVESIEPMPLAAWQCWPRLEGVAAEAYQEPIAPRKTVARPEWVELMRSLREDIARRRAELNAPQAAPVAQTAPAAPKPQPAPAHVVPQAARPAAPTAAGPGAAAAAAAAAADALKKRPKRTRPIEDEWGLFDPEQCGFAALLDKLDEITVPPPASHPRR
jgi:hypothetical protein